MLSKCSDIVVIITAFALISGSFAEEKVKEGWWSWEPLKGIKLPVVEKANPIDRFIVSTLKAQGLFMSQEADRRVLIRRLYFDLWGMPPTPKEVNRFIKDPDPSAYKKLVDELLLSPRYGERWARHWLDVVHYGETHGYDKDKPRPNAWPYRDYVIRAFNEDKPYSRFIKEQIAGDILWPDTVDGIVATGFIAAGPWDFIGHAEVPETKIDGKVARHLDRDDMVTTTMNTFTSLTAQCAQCHDHKRDPVTMEHYYSLQSVFAALDRADRPYDMKPDIALKRQDLREKKKEIERGIAENKKKIDASRSPEIVALQNQIESIENKLKAAKGDQKGRSSRYGYHSQVASVQGTMKWVQIDLGSQRKISSVILAGADEYGFSDFGFPHRFRLEISTDSEFKDSKIIANNTGSDFPRPGSKPVLLSGDGSKARYVRLTATKLWSRRMKGQPETNDWIFAMGEMAVISDKELLGAKEVIALDSIEAKERWGKSNLIDGIYGTHSLESLIASEKSKTNGYHSAFAKKISTRKWVQIELPEIQSIDKVVIYPARPTDFHKDTPGFGFPERFKILLSDREDMTGADAIIDETDSDYTNPGVDPAVFDIDTKRGRYLRLEATKLNHPKGSGGPMLALSEVRIYSGSKEISRNARVTSLDTINSGLWHRRNLVDGYTSRRLIVDGVTEGLLSLAKLQPDESENKLNELRVRLKDLQKSSIDPKLIKEKESLAKSLSSINSEFNGLPKSKMVYAGTVHSGGGTFKGRGHAGGKPRDIFVLHRGEVTDPRDPVRPGTVPGIVPEISYQFNLPEDHKEGDRRVALAEWISHKENTLTWRSIVNRVWHYHFGRGIVDTPNDFGRIGSKPTHPELLDWLAIWFRDNGGSIKDLHRLILNSATYKQVSDHHQGNALIDISNKYLWRQNRRRLDAESLRDTVLFVSGKMNFEMGGPSFKDFVIEKPQHSPHYQYHKYDPDDPLTHRRSVYRFIVRSQPQPFMDTFDCADPSQLVDKRGETTTALQALALLNNHFMVKMSQRFSENISESPDPVRIAFEAALSRIPSQDELVLLRSYAERHGLAATCRIIFNLNEFSFID
jgi:hypothetical protein